MLKKTATLLFDPDRRGLRLPMDRRVGEKGDYRPCLADDSRSYVPSLTQHEGGVVHFRSVREKKAPKKPGFGRGALTWFSTFFS